MQIWRQISPPPEGTVMIMGLRAFFDPIFESYPWIFETHRCGTTNRKHFVCHWLRSAMRESLRYCQRVGGALLVTPEHRQSLLLKWHELRTWLFLGPMTQYCDPLSPELEVAAKSASQRGRLVSPVIQIRDLLENNPILPLAGQSTTSPYSRRTKFITTFACGFFWEAFFREGNFFFVFQMYSFFTFSIMWHQASNTWSIFLCTFLHISWKIRAKTCVFSGPEIVHAYVFETASL